MLKENVEYIEEVGGLPYDILKPVLLMANAQILTRIEDCNPHLMMDTSEVKFIFFIEFTSKLLEQCTEL